MEKNPILIIAFFFVACTSFPGQRDLGKVNNLTADRLKKEYNLSSFGSGSCWPEKCQAISLDFISDSRATIPEARRLIVHAVQIAVASALSVKTFEQYLERPPFTSEQVMLGILFEKPPQDADGALIEFALIVGNRISYYINEDRNPIYRETLEEARRIVEGEELGMSTNLLQ